MAKNRMVLINRNEYNRIKKMDHATMTAFLQEQYRQAFNEGKKAAEGLTSDELGELILQIKGIGARRAEIIVNAVNEAMEKKRQRKGV